jgi:hypothetical protein
MKNGIIAFCLVCISFEVLGQSTDQWEPEMLRFEELDRTNQYHPQSILFTGSSSIRLWNTLENDMAPMPVIKRGFGGSKMEDVIKHADRFIGVHQFSKVVVFVANDITGSENDKSPEEVKQLFKAFVEKMRAYQPGVPVYIIAITPTASRWKVWNQIKEANSKLLLLSKEMEGVVLISTEDLFLGENGQPIPDLFVSDQLHLSEKGYVLWAKRIRSYLE